MKRGLQYFLCGIALTGLYIEAFQDTYQTRINAVLSEKISIRFSPEELAKIFQEAKGNGKAQEFVQALSAITKRKLNYAPIVAIFNQSLSEGDRALFGDSITDFLRAQGVSPLTVEGIKAIFNANLLYEEKMGVVEKFLLDPAMKEIVDHFFSDSRTLESILQDGGKMAGNIKAIFKKYWDKKIAAIMASDDKESAFRELYSSVSSVMMKKFLEARILEKGYDTQLGTFGNEIRANFSSIFNFGTEMTINKSVEVLKTLYSFVGVPEVNTLLLTDPTRQSLEQFISNSTLEIYLVDDDLKSNFRSLLEEYYIQEIQKIMESGDNETKKLAALEGFYKKQNWKFGKDVLEKVLLNFYNEDLRRFISTGTTRQNFIKAFCEKTLDKEILGKSVLNSMNDLLAITRSLSDKPLWRDRFFDFIMNSSLPFDKDQDVKLLIEFLQLNQSPSLVSSSQKGFDGRTDFNDIKELYIKFGKVIAGKILSTPVILKKVGKLIDAGTLDRFFEKEYGWMAFDDLVEKYYREKFKTLSLEEVAGKLKELAGSARQKILEKIVAEKFPNDFEIVDGVLVKSSDEELKKKEADLLERLYSKAIPTEDQLIKLFDDITASRIMTRELQFEFSKVPGDARMSLIYAIQTMQLKQGSVDQLSQELFLSDVFKKYPRLWFVLANKCMEGQQEEGGNPKEMQKILLASLSERNDRYSSLKVSSEKRGFFVNLRNRCVSWLKAWPIKKKHNGAKSDKDRFQEAVFFMKANSMIRYLMQSENEQVKESSLWTDNIAAYRMNPEDMCREIGVMLSKCSGKGVTLEQVRDLLTQLAETTGVTRNMIDDEIVRRLPTNMQKLFGQEMQNLLEQDNLDNVILDNAEEHLDGLSELKTEPKRRPGASSAKTSGEKPVGGSKGSVSATITSTSGAMQTRAQIAAEEALKKRRELIDQIARTQGTEVLPDRPVEAARR